MSVIGIEISKDADIVLRAAYKEYVKRRKDGKPKSVARSFEDTDEIDCGDMLPCDVNEAINELNSVGLLKAYIVGFNLTDPAIVAMENRFKDVPGKVLSAVDKTASVVGTVVGSAVAAYEKGKTNGA